MPTSIRHGNDQWTSKYNLIQHRCITSNSSAVNSGFVEVLEVQGSTPALPDRSTAYIIHTWYRTNNGDGRSAYWEFNSLQRALNALQEEKSDYLNPNTLATEMQIGRFLPWQHCNRMGFDWKSKPWFYEA